MAIAAAVVLAGFVVAWFFRNSEGLTLWVLRVVVLLLLLAAGAIGMMDAQPWPQDFQVAEHR